MNLAINVSDFDHDDWSEFELKDILSIGQHTDNGEYEKY